ncbi:helix-turn-helix domain-containing protein [bacterium]|nr:helix-turn-helix domain-containing protein [bacterium]
MMITRKYLTRKEVQQMLNLDRAEMLHLIKSKKLKAYRLDNKIVFEYKDVEKFMIMIDPAKDVDPLKYK